MIHLYSGDGKGKTSIATGMAVRMAGAGGHVLFARFMKGGESSELSVLRGLSTLRILQAGKDFPFYSQMTEAEKGEMKLCHDSILDEVLTAVETAAEVPADGMPSLLLVMDEITYPCNWELIEVAKVQKLLDSVPDYVELVLTGRNPPDFMVEAADYYSEVCMRKHPYEKGLAARVGVEF